MSEGWSAWPAPAKLNLFLRITGRRADGYHELQTVFRLLDWGDRVWLRLRRDGRIERHGGSVPGVAAADDLAVRAAELLRKEANVALGADIRIEKRIPAGGGFGGGSSDAATVLCVLDRLWGLGLGEDRLAALGLRLGADVPVFVRGRSAWGEGVGERLQPVALEPRWYLVLFPGCAVHTGKVFADPELTRNTPRITMAAFRAGLARNDCEPVVRRLYPEVGQALDWLGQHAPARLTGTGGCVFAAFTEEASARAVLAQVPARWQAFVARGVDISPLWLAVECQAA